MELIWLIPALPVAGFVILTFLGRRIGDPGAGWLATLDGDYWGRGRVTLAPVQTLGDSASLDWSAAVAAFEAARQRAHTNSH